MSQKPDLKEKFIQNSMNFLKKKLIVTRLLKKVILNQIIARQKIIIIVQIYGLNLEPEINVPCETAQGASQ